MAEGATGKKFMPGPRLERIFGFYTSAQRTQSKADMRSRVRNLPRYATPSFQVGPRGPCDSLSLGNEPVWDGYGTDYGRDLLASPDEAVIPAAA